MGLKELREKRQRLIAQARELVERADKEGRGTLSDEENQSYDKIMKEQDELRLQIERKEKLESIEKDLRTIPQGEKAVDIRPDANANDFRASKEYRDIFKNWLAFGQGALNRLPEERALSVGVLTQGGALVAPEEFVSTLIKFVDDQVFIRPLATKYQLTKSISLGAPSLDTDPADADWTSEIATGSEDSSMAFGKRQLTPHPLAKRIKLSQTLVQNSAVPVDTLVAQRLAYKFGITEEKAFMSGNGAAQPLGLFTASTAGISTARDVVTGSATGFTFDGLIDAKFTLKGNYWPNARWLFHRNALNLIAKLKDTTNQYLWQPSNQQGQPDRLLGVPVLMSEYVPNTYTTGLYVGMIADFSQYWIVDNLNMTVQRLVELYAETNQIGYIGRMEVDGMPVLAEAFVRLKTS